MTNTGPIIIIVGLSLSVVLDERVRGSNMEATDCIMKLSKQIKHLGIAINRRTNFL